MHHGAEQRRRFWLGARCTAMVVVLGLAIWGTRGAVAAGTLGLIATGLQLAAAQVMVRTGVKPSVDHLAVYVMGMLLRVLGVVTLYALVTRWPGTFGALPCAMGYLGTVLPLLYLETRLSR